MQIARITEGWHKLFEGSNGHITNGVSVQAIHHEPNSGYRQFWEVNDYSFRANPKEVKDKLGLTDEEYIRYRFELMELQEQQEAEIYARKPDIRAVVQIA